MGQREAQQLIAELESLRTKRIHLLEDGIGLRLKDLYHITGIPTPPPLDLTQAYESIGFPIVEATLIVSPRDLQPGDRVRITNSVSRRTMGRTPTEQDRVYAVRRVVLQARRVLIATALGIATWRYTRNLSRF